MISGPPESPLCSDWCYLKASRPWEHFLLFLCALNHTECSAVASELFPCVWMDTKSLHRVRVRFERSCASDRSHRVCLVWAPCLKNVAGERWQRCLCVHGLCVFMEERGFCQGELQKCPSEKVPGWETCPDLAALDKRWCFHSQVLSSLSQWMQELVFRSSVPVNYWFEHLRKTDTWGWRGLQGAEFSTGCNQVDSLKMFSVEPLELLSLALEILLTDNHMRGKKQQKLFLPLCLALSLVCSLGSFQTSFWTVVSSVTPNVFTVMYLAVSTGKVTPAILSLFSPATAELETGSTGASPVGSTDRSSKNVHVDQDPLSRAIQEYRDVLTKNYMIY